MTRQERLLQLQQLASQAAAQAETERVSNAAAAREAAHQDALASVAPLNRQLQRQALTEARNSPEVLALIEELTETRYVSLLQENLSTLLTYNRNLDGQRASSTSNLLSRLIAMARRQ